MATVDLEHVTVRKAGATLLDDVSLHLDDGEMLGVIGASGSGKTTLLRVIAGVDEVAAGTVRIDGADVTGVAPSARGASMVFQRAALIPHRDVRGNVAFPLELRHEGESEIATRVAAETRAMHIDALLARSPHELSTGEAQLVQVARALVRAPRLLLLDEPLAGLDSMLTAWLRPELRALQQGYGVTTVLATNDPLEAMSLPDRLLVLDGGRVVQTGTPIDVYERPATLTAAAGTGSVSVLSAPGQCGPDGGRVLLAVRPTSVRLAAGGPLHGVITEVGIVTGTVTVELHGDSAGEIVVAAPGPPRRRGEQVELELVDVLRFDADTGIAIEGA